MRETIICRLSWLLLFSFHLTAPIILFLKYGDIDFSIGIFSLSFLLLPFSIYISMIFYTFFIEFYFSTCKHSFKEIEDDIKCSKCGVISRNPHHNDWWCKHNFITKKDLCYSFCTNCGRLVTSHLWGIRGSGHFPSNIFSPMYIESCKRCGVRKHFRKFY